MVVAKRLVGFCELLLCVFHRHSLVVHCHCACMSHATQKLISLVLNATPSVRSFRVYK